MGGSNNMSASAGRILILPKGAYVAGTTYHILDYVRYNGKTFIARRTNTNVTPVDGADWMEVTDSGVLTFNGRSGAVTPQSGDYDAGDIEYGQISVEDALDALTSLETFELDATDWEANQDSSTNTDYPYIFTITTTDYTANSRPNWDIDGAGDILTATERASANYILEAVFSATDIVLYAKDLPTVDLVLVVKGK